MQWLASEDGAHLACVLDSTLAVADREAVT
jgi:hypothetical protein